MANTTGKKFGGREKGTPNKLTKELRSALKDVLYDEIEQIPHRLDEVGDQGSIGVIGQVDAVCLPEGAVGVAIVG